MTMQELMKLCTNVMVSSTFKRNLFSSSRTPNKYSRSFKKRNFSMATKPFTHYQCSQNLETRVVLKHIKYCFASSVYNNNNDNLIFHKHYSLSTYASNNSGNNNMEFSDEDTKNVLSEDMQVVYDFISEEEEDALLKEVEPHLKRLRYESSHWDDAIHGYRETERKTWTEKNKTIIQRVRDTAFPAGVPQLAHVHVLDLQKDGYIKAHVDAVKFCGSTIAGISLLSPCIMRLVHTDDKSKFADILLERRSLYIMKDAARYNYTHEVLPDKSLFRGQTINKDRRISVICRNEP